MIGIDYFLCMNISKPTHHVVMFPALSWYCYHNMCAVLSLLMCYIPCCSHNLAWFRDVWVFIKPLFLFLQKTHPCKVNNIYFFILVSFSSNFFCYSFLSGHSPLAGARVHLSPLLETGVILCLSPLLETGAILCLSPFL